MTEETRPSWDDAPEWAKFLAQDDNGRWYWYADRPDWNRSRGHFEPNGRFEIATPFETNPGPICHRPKQ